MQVLASTGYGTVRTGAPNPFTDPVLAASYEAWYAGPGRRADRLETALLKRLLEGLSGARSVLEIGSGTGHFGRLLSTRSSSVTGIDVSLPMLVVARSLGGPPAAWADAHRLPYRDGSVDVSFLVATLAFTDEPVVVLAEAARVARLGIVVGALNRVSRLGRRIARCNEEPWCSAAPLSVADLIRLTHTAMHGRRHVVRWRTTLWPLWPGPLPLPWGDFIGLSARWD